VNHAREVLRKVVSDRARDPDNPWAVCHAILALGADIRLTNGEGAVDYLFSEYARVREVGGEKLIYFPLKTRREIGGRTVEVMVEAHPELVLKALAERGAAPGRKVVVKGETFTLGHLYRHCLWRSWVEGGRAYRKHWSDVAWGLRGLATWAPAGLSWTAEGEHRMTLDAYAEAALLNLRECTADRRRAVAEGKRIDDRQPGLNDYTCGGFHYVEAVGYALARGFGTDEDRNRFAEEADILIRGYQPRLDYLEMVRLEHPEALGMVLQQRYKFIGHFVETSHKLAALGLFDPDERQRALLRRAVKDLLETVAVLERVEIFDRLDEIRKVNPQVYLDYVGDSAHALRGLDLATGKATVGY
jgi:hypothetical protein